MSYLGSFPKSRRGSQRTFWSISRLWYTDKHHNDNSRCDGCTAPRSRAAIYLELRALIMEHVRPEWQAETLERLPRLGQMELSYGTR
jgi:hypothetical protein